MGLITLALFLLAVAGPVMIGARIVGAGRTGFWACLAAVIVATIIGWVAVLFLHRLGLLSIFVTALAYMWVLDTTYLRALAIAVIQIAIFLLVAFAIALTALGSAIHIKDIFRHFETTPAQSV